MKFNEDVLAVIVLYKIKLSDSLSFKSLSASLKPGKNRLELLVYDNSPEYNVGQEFDDYKKWNITYQADPENSGVSKAYNSAAALAAKKGKNWLLLLDQDTNFPVVTLAAYETAINNYPGEKLFVPVMITTANEIISPAHFKMMRGFYAKNIKPGINDLQGYSTINCGMCIALSAFNGNDGYNELIKLDFSDHDFIRRFKKKITAAVVVIDLTVRHNLSTSEKTTFNQDRVRFKYFLDGSGYFSQSFGDSVLLNTHAFLRALKLTITHKNIFFLKSVVKHILD
jgi:rhamnosyltransferase